MLDFIAVKLVIRPGLEESVFPPGAPWHPLEIARQEAAEAELGARIGG